jgi:hypothetical protein
LACNNSSPSPHSSEEKVAAPATTSYGIDTNWYAATTSYGIDTNWYANLGATDHVTSDLDKLSVRYKYASNDQVYTTSGSGMEIQHIGNSTLHTPSHDLILKNILHVPTVDTH